MSYCTDVCVGGLIPAVRLLNLFIVGEVFVCHGLRLTLSQMQNPHEEFHCSHFVVAEW